MKSTKSTIKLPVRIEAEKFDFYLYDLPEDTTEANLEKQELKFTTSINIYNDSQTDLLIRIRTNKKDLYTVNPAYSLIEKGSFIDLKISYLLKSINEDYSKHKFKIETLEIPNLKKVIENTLSLCNNNSNSSLLRKSSVKKTFFRKSTLFPQVPTESINSVVKAIFEKNEINKDFETKSFIKEVNIYYKKSRYQAEKIKSISKTNSSTNLIKAFPFAKGKSTMNIYSAFAGKNVSSSNLNNLKIKLESPTKKSLYIDFNTRTSPSSDKFISLNDLKLNYYVTEIQITKEEEEIAIMKERLNFVENQLKLLSFNQKELSKQSEFEDFTSVDCSLNKENNRKIFLLYFVIFLFGLIVGNNYI